MDNAINSPASAALEFCFQLARTQARLSRRFDGHLGSFHGIGFADLMVMLELGRAEGGRLRRVDLADKLGLTASAVTRMLIPMERIGLVDRQRDPNDARVGYASLTKAGVRVLEEALTTAEHIGTTSVSESSTSELRSMTKTLVGFAG